MKEAGRAIKTQLLAKCKWYISRIVFQDCVYYFTIKSTLEILVTYRAFISVFKNV